MMHASRAPRTLVLAACGVLAAGSTAAPADRTRDQQFAGHLERLLKDGLQGRFDSSRINRHAANARRLHPRDASVEYAVALVMLKRIRVPPAIRQLQAAVRKAPLYVPAWTLLLRTRLVQKDAKSLQQESVKLAAAIADRRSTPQEPSHREHAAELLGRVVGFLELPDVALLPDRDVKEFEADLKRRLGAAYHASFEAGKKSLRTDSEKLQAQVDRDLIKQSLKQRREKDDKLSELEKKKAAAVKKEKTLQRTAAQWNTWHDEQTAAAKKQLAELKKDYATLQSADARVSRLATQTTIEIGRLQTELSLRGIRGRVADMQPAMLRLQQESMRYTQQRLALQQRAARVRLQAGRVLAAHAVATRQYQDATGRIVKQDASVRTWQTMLARTSASLKEKAPSKRPAALLKSQLSDAGSYFELDFEAESQRLLKPYRRSPASR